MKIAVNTRLLLKDRMEGIGWFAYEILNRLCRQHPEHEFYFLFDRPYNEEFIFSENVHPVVIGPPSRHPVLWFTWFELRLPGVLKRIKPDVFVSPEGFLPLGTHVPCVATMHDIAYEHYPDTVPRLVGLYYRYFMPRFARKARVLATVSDYSKKDIAENYHVPPGKIRVVYNGCHEEMHALREEEKEKVRLRLTGGKPYFMFVGGLYPRKNIKRLMQAFDIFKANDRQETKLVLVGKKAYKSGELEQLQQSLKYGRDIIFTGRVEGTDVLSGIIASSIAMVYVSLFEGFGVPCLEAMRCETAVITSHTSSLPEVCGDAAIYVDPFSVNSIAQAMRQVISDPQVRLGLIEKGRKQAEKFSWQQTSDKFWQAILEAAGRS